MTTIVTKEDRASLDRPRSPCGSAVRVLDHGYVKLIDFLGNDEDVVDAARMSTGKGFISWEPYRRCKECTVVEMSSGEVRTYAAPDQGHSHVWENYPNGDLGLLDHLWRNRHATPFEMCEMVIEVQAPIMVFREWHRHRTQCLTGNTELHFDLPGGLDRRGTQKYTMTIKEVFEKFQPTQRASRPERQTNPFHPRDRVQEMHLRCVNEETLETAHTSIVDVWESGEKEVYAVAVGEGGPHEQRIIASAEHPFFTPKGWKRLKELIDLSETGSFCPTPDAEVYVVNNKPSTTVSVEIPAVEPEEGWRPVVGWQDYYEVSNMGRIRRTAGGQGVKSSRTCKRLTEGNTGYLCVSLNKPGQQARLNVHAVVLEAFSGPRPDGAECRHLDGNKKNNWASNLKWGTSKENAEDRVQHGTAPSLKSVAVRIDYVRRIGFEKTYDIEVAGPWHNFVAEGFVVHNSFNEFSARYAVMPNLHYVPSAERLKALKSSNKQAASLDQHLGEEADYDKMLAGIDDEQKSIYAEYERMLEQGVPKEVARINTPVSRYSKMRVKTDLRNWLAFENLRIRPSAQWEIRQYAEIVGLHFMKTLFPQTWALFEEYDLYAARFSRTELRILRSVMGGNSIREAVEEAKLVGQKKEDFMLKLSRGGEEILG